MALTTSKVDRMCVFVTTLSAVSFLLWQGGVLAGFVAIEAFATHDGLRLGRAGEHHEYQMKIERFYNECTFNPASVMGSA
jgi:hypothetical protein